VRRRRLGAELRRLREAAGLTGDQVIARVGWASASKLSRLENGRSRPDLGDVLDLLDLYGVAGRARDELVAITRDAGNTRGWLRGYAVMTQRQRGFAELEAGCAEIREYAPVLIPGLLQTPEYARVRIRSSRPLLGQPTGAVEPPGNEVADPDDVQTEVAARIARQSLLTRAVDPPRYEAVIEEFALLRHGGPPDVLRGQLVHLHRVAQLPHVTLRVLPRDAAIRGWYVPQTAFSLYGYADPEDPSPVAVEALAADMIIIDESVVARYSLVFDWLRDAALPPDESLRWLGEATRDPPQRATTPTASPPTPGGASAGPPARTPTQRARHDRRRTGPDA
jgi:transcriptional regulator with XRE-family HTH domain